MAASTPTAPRSTSWTRWAALAASLAFAALGGFLYQQERKVEARARFAGEAANIAHDLDIRLRAYEGVLFAVRGLFDSSDQVTRGDFDEFVGALGVEQRFPGLANVNFSPRVSAQQKRSFEREVRAETRALARGLPEFSIKPPGERPEYVVLNYVFPLGPNAGAWGLDLLAHSGRSAAVERARDAGGLASTSGVALLRDAGSGSKSSLLRLAVYRGGGVPASLEERQVRFAGVAGATLRIRDVVEATLARQFLARARVVIFPDPEDAPAAEGPIYDSEGRGGQISAQDYPEYGSTQYLSVGDRAWRLEMMPLANPLGTPGEIVAIAAAAAGSFVASALLFGLANLLLLARARGDELARRNRVAARLGEFGESIYSCNTTAEASDTVARHMSLLLPGTSGALFVLQDGHSAAGAAARWGEPVALGGLASSQDCQAVRRGHFHGVGDAAHAQNCAHFAGAPPDRYACIPLSAQGELIGVLHVQRARGLAGDIAPAEAAILQSAAQPAALALANLALRERLSRQATRDELTGLYNRHYVQEWFEQELRRAMRYSRPIGVILVDIDYFKRINDRLGHGAGDQVLKAVARLLKAGIRASDIACRYGGEEFLVLLPEADLEGSVQKAERLRKDLEALTIEYHGALVGPITASLGVAVFPRHGNEPGELVRRADQALYAAKEGGRNRTVAWTQASPVTGRSVVPAAA